MLPPQIVVLPACKAVGLIVNQQKKYNKDKINMLNEKNFFTKFNCGKINYFPYVVFAGNIVEKPNYCSNIDNDFNTAQLSSEYKSILKDDIYFNYTEGGIICRRVFQNISDRVLKIKELGFCLSGINFGQNPKDDYFYHNENPRIYEVMTFPIDYNRTAEDAKDSNFDIQAGNRWADPGVVTERIGASPYQPFPAILISNYNTNKGIVHGTLNQDVFFHNYLVKHENNAVKIDIYSSFKNIDYMELQSGRILIDEWYLGETENADDIEKIFEGYTNVLRSKLPVRYGSTNINRYNVVWGSWNDGVFYDVSEEMLLNVADYIKKYFPTVKWFQLDAGYSANKDNGIGAPYEGDAGIDGNKFPHGLRHFTDKIREKGLRPAIWIGGRCPSDTKIYKEHPEWFIEYSRRMTNTQPLDVSQKEVRDYMLKAVDKLCLEYGFDGVKQDFWSYPFEDSESLYKNKTASGYEYRKWWLSEIRKRLPNDGYMQSGCDIAMGNPFLGEYFTNYRYGIDIAEGKWDNIKTNFLWGTACFANHTGDMIVPNSDAIGMLPGLNETDAMFWINYCITTHTIVELAGVFSKVSEDNKRLKVLQKAVCNPNNGQDVYFIGYNYRSHKYSVPQIMYFKTPHFSLLESSEGLPLRTVGLFNVNEKDIEIKFNIADLGLEKGSYIFTDVWSGEQLKIDNTYAIKLPPHGSKLIAVNKINGIQLLDSNIRIKNIVLENECIELFTDYKAEAELLFNKKPCCITFNKSKLDFNTIGAKVLCHVSGKGVLKVVF
jgi:hypothetical protein